MPDLRVKDWLRLAVLLALVAVVVVLEIASHTVRDFYVEHPLQAGVLTGVLLSVVAYFGFDAVRARLDDVRWGPLSTIAFLSLAYSTTLIIDTLLWLATGIQPKNEAKPPRRDQETLERLLQQAAIQPPHAADLGALEAGDYCRSLDALLVDEAWRGFAVATIDTAKWRHRDQIASWAAAMLTTGEAAAVLNRVAELNESLSVLQSWLRALTPSDAYHRRATPAGTRETWLATHAEAVSLREDLVRAARGISPTWEAFRRALPADHRRLLEARARQAARRGVRKRAQLAGRPRGGRAARVEEVGARELLVTRMVELPAPPPERTPA